MKQHIKLLIFIAIEFIAVAIIFLLIFFAGRKTYTVTFDLNGGILLSGDLVQTVRRGQTATPPEVTKDGCYLLEWKGDYRKVTKDSAARAIWEYETTYGIEYEVVKNSNYCLISGCYKELSGDVYIGAYYNDLKVLGIKSGAFKDCNGIKSIHLLEGIIAIDDEAFSGCTSLEKIDIPNTVEKLGNNLFEGCLSLKEVIIPLSVKKMGNGVFQNDQLTINCMIKEEDIPDTWDKNWYYGTPTIVYDYGSALLENESEKEKNSLFG